MYKTGRGASGAGWRRLAASLGVSATFALAVLSRSIPSRSLDPLRLALRWCGLISLGSETLEEARRGHRLVVPARSLAAGAGLTQR